MKIAHVYNHLNGLEFLQVNKPQILDEIKATIGSIDAGQFIKESKDKTKKGKLIYNQRGINKKFVELLTPLDWKEKKIKYYVTADVRTAREIAGIKEESDQKDLIVRRGFEPLQTSNQVDFMKDRVAVEIQVGKYAFVAYDLHVKHTFFFLRDEIDVGVEIIPTHRMMKKMDTGVAWFENEVANVIREGKSNPAVPLVILGIEPEQIEI